MAETADASSGYTLQPSTTSFTLPPVPEAPLDYPIKFNNPNSNSSNNTATEEYPDVNLFSSLSWLRPLFEQAEFLLAKDVRAYLQAAEEDETHSSSNSNSESRNALLSAAEEAAITKEFPDVALCLRLLPLFQRFFEEEKKMIPQHTDYYYTITRFVFPTPKGERSITRSKVEGDSRAKFAKPVHASSSFNNSNNNNNGGAQLASATVTNTTSVFSLLPGHDNFLVYYEKDKLNIPAQKTNSNNSNVTVTNKKSAFSLFTYLELDQLRFAFAAVKELIEESKTFNLSDGSLSLLAKRDIKKNNFSSTYCLNPKSTAAAAEDDAGGDANVNANASDSHHTSNRAGKATNVITAPRKEIAEEKRDIAQKRFLKTDLEEECQRRWPHTPVSKSCVFLFEEKAEADLTEEEITAMGLDARRIQVNKSKNRKGQKFFLGVVELSLLNKKGGAARFKAARLWNMKRDAESAAAEAALTALRTVK